ncbi:MAG: hypothetical protein LW720_05400 [Pirellula sp.]|nr:hypothetical protein [Pirellula sp.]
MAPSAPPPLTPPAKAPVEQGEPSGWMERTPGPVVITTGRGCVSPPGLMNAYL